VQAQEPVQNQVDDRKPFVGFPFEAWRCSCCFLRFFLEEKRVNILILIISKSQKEHVINHTFSQAFFYKKKIG